MLLTASDKDTRGFTAKVRQSLAAPQRQLAPGACQHAMLRQLWASLGSRQRMAWCFTTRQHALPRRCWACLASPVRAARLPVATLRLDFTRMLLPWGPCQVVDFGLSRVCSGEYLRTRTLGCAEYM